MNIESLTRRELQWVAKELQLCRANAKSEVIIDAIQDHICQNGEEEIVQVVNSIPEEFLIKTPRKANGIKTPSRTGPLTRSTRKQVTNDAPPSDDGLTRNINRQFDFSDQPDEIVADGEMMKSTHNEPESEQNITDESTEIASESLAQVPQPEMPNDVELHTKKEATPEQESIEMKLSEESCAPETLSNEDIQTEMEVENLLPKDDVAEKVKPQHETTSPEFEQPQTTEKVAENDDVHQLVKKMSNLEFSSATRVRCNLTGHEMKPCTNEIQTYLNGKKYVKAAEQTENLKEFEPMFVPYPNKPSLMLCQVTGAEVLRNRKSIQHHMAGNRYKSLIGVWSTLNNQST